MFSELDSSIKIQKESTDDILFDSSISSSSLSTFYNDNSFDKFNDTDRISYNSEISLTSEDYYILHIKCRTSGIKSSNFCLSKRGAIIREFNFIR